MTASERIRKARESRDGSRLLSISRTTYESLRRHDYAGRGTPINPAAPGYWAMVNENGATVLYTGITIEEDA